MISKHVESFLDRIEFWLAKRAMEHRFTESPPPPEKPEHLRKIDRMQAHAVEVSKRLKG